MAEHLTKQTFLEKVFDYEKNKEWKFEIILKASKILYDEFTPISDARSGAEFRRLAAKNLLIKFFEENYSYEDPEN